MGTNCRWLWRSRTRKESSNTSRPFIDGVDAVIHGERSEEFYGGVLLRFRTDTRSSLAFPTRPAHLNTGRPTCPLAPWHCPRCAASPIGRGQHALVDFSQNLVVGRVVARQETL